MSTFVCKLFSPYVDVLGNGVLNDLFREAKVLELLGALCKSLQIGEGV